MPFALDDFSIAFLTLNAPGDLFFNEGGIQNDIPSYERPAYVRIMNESGFGLKMNLITSGVSFWMRAGECTTVPIIRAERGLRFFCQYILAGTYPDRLWCTYFFSGERLSTIESLGNSR